MDPELGLEFTLRDMFLDAQEQTEEWNRDERREQRDARDDARDDEPSRRDAW